MRLQFRNIDDKNPSGFSSRDGGIPATKPGLDALRTNNGPREGKGDDGNTLRISRLPTPLRRGKRERGVTATSTIGLRDTFS
jgi:hypothetical protein